MIYHGNWQALNDLPSEVEKTVENLRNHVDEFDSIVVTGVSGLVVGSPVALALGKSLVIVRKMTEDCHDGNQVVNAANIGERALFLDDFVSEGNTRRKVQDAISTTEARLYGEYMYRDERYYRYSCNPLSEAQMYVDYYVDPTQTDYSDNCDEVLEYAFG
jgi:orotate phosphoribosyltransferase